MKRVWTAFSMALSMFSAVPLRLKNWDEALRRHMIACLPLVGLVIGTLWWALALLARHVLPRLLASALIAAAPFLLTGFIHLDGFMDTSDAMLSWRSREERLRILKDSHVGSFAVVMIALLFMLQFAAAASIERCFALLLIPLLSRCGSALCVLRLRPLGHSQYAASDAAPACFTVAVLAQGALALAALGAALGWHGLIVGAVVSASYALAMRWCVRALGGVSGDLAGFSLTVSELCGLIALAIIR